MHEHVCPGGRSGLLLAAAAILSATPVHPQTAGTSAYVTDTRGSVVRNAPYLCWHTGYWTPAAAIAECDPDLVPRPPAKPARAASAPDNKKSRAVHAKDPRVEIEAIGGRPR